jgi:hypothetical protein
MVALAYPSQPATRRTERRIFARRQSRMLIEARRLDHSLAAHRPPRLTLQLSDVSLGGMSALSDAPVSFGEHVRVSFPPQGNTPCWDAFGRVTRCEISPMGYRLAVEFDPLPAT